MLNISTKFGLSRRGTILKYNGNGTVLVALDEVGLAQTPQQFNVPLPMSWSGPNGEFAGGCPVAGSSVILSQGQGGQWFIDSYLPSRGSFTDRNLMSSVREGRFIAQTRNGYRFFIDPTLGFQAGDSENFLHADPKLDILSHNFSSEMSFTEAHRKIVGPVKRDLIENSNRTILGSPLSSHIYDESFFTIGLDPTASVSVNTRGERVRNPPLVENREVIYEFAPSYGFTNDEEESQRYLDEKSFSPKVNNGRRDSRADAFSLNLGYPNHLIESVKGTSVDAFGNVLDLNRNVLPLGKIDLLSLRKNPDKSDAFARIRAEHRKGIAFHFEINTRKSMDIIPGDSGSTTPSPVSPDVNDTSNYARNRSHWFFDVDKEGQTKLNIPASSETGNIALSTRYENYSTLLAKKEGSDPNTITRNATNQEIFLENFAGKANIKLTTSDSSLSGLEAPIDRITGEPIKYGTSFHDITKACNTFLPDAQDIVLFDSSHYLNQLEPYEKLVSDTIIVSGKDANAGGRSLHGNLDGFACFNIGANTIDRQSLWVDCAGGAVFQLGRDKRGISYAAHLDGDMIVQIGGAGIGNEFDSRFADQNDAARLAALDIRVLTEPGMMTVIRVDKQGVSIATPGHIDFSAGGDVNFKSKARMSFNAEQIFFYSDTGLVREVERKKVNI